MMGPYIVASMVMKIQVPVCDAVWLKKQLTAVSEGVTASVFTVRVVEFSWTVWTLKMEESNT